MSGVPGFIPDEGGSGPRPEANDPSLPGSAPQFALQSQAVLPPAPGEVEEALFPSDPIVMPSDHPPADEPLFAHYEQYPPPASLRIPNLGHLLVFIVVLGGGYLSSGLILLIALHFHMFGVSTIKQAEDEIHYRLGSQAAWYLITLLGCMAIFPLLWRRGFFDGLQWRAAAAARNRWRLVSAAVACFVVAIADSILIPGPANAPIDQTFRLPGAAWLLFVLGVTLAPLIEEIAFRGFLLPALCTAYDWAMERRTGSQAPRPDENGDAQWSIPAMVVASMITSIPFALMHGEQTAYSLGPFLLLFCISLVLCWVRLAARSLAASVVVHSSYNLLLFSLMLLGTGGFRHLDKM